MKITLRITALLFALVMILSTTVSCGALFDKFFNKGDNETEQTDVKDTGKKPANKDSSATQEGTDSETETEVETDEWGQVVIDKSELEGLNFNGAVVNVVVREAQYGREWTREKIQDAVDNEVFKRNRKVQTNLNVTFNFITIADNSQTSGGGKPMTEAITKVAQSGGKEYDILNQYRNDAGGLELMPYYANVRSSDFLYLDLDQPYWSQNFNKVLNANDKQYFFVGDINLSLWDRAIVTFFNKAQLETYTGYTEEELYQLVIDEQWTYEVLFNLTKAVHNDATNNGKSQDDFFGLISIGGSEATDGLLYSWDVALSKTNVDGSHSIVTDSAKQKIIDAGDKLIALYTSNGAYLNKNSDANIKQFTEGKALFSIDTICHNQSHLAALGEMEDGYGVIPTPMYDTDQEEYYTGVQDAHTIMSVMSGNKDYEMISAVLEMLAIESYESVRPYYVKVIIKSRVLGDTQSGKMFDLIMDGVTLDFIDMFEGVDPKVRWQLWRKPFQRSVGFISGGELSFATAFEEANGNGALDSKLFDLDLFLDRME